MSSRTRGAGGRHSRSGSARPLGLAGVVVALVAALAAETTVAAAELPEPAPPPAGVRRIVSLVPSVTETIFALGAEDRLVGVSTYCDHPPQVARWPRVGSYLAPELETIVSLRPDVVIGVPTPGNRAAVERLRELGVPVVVVGERTLADARAAIRTIAAWTGQPARGEALVGRIDGELEQVRREVAPLPRRRVLLVVGHDPLVVAGRGMFVDQLLELVGGDNSAAGASGRWPQLSMEAVVAAAPEVIIDGAMGSEAVDSIAGYWKPLASVPAVRDGRLVALRSPELLRPGPRLGDAARQLAGAVHGGSPGSISGEIPGAMPGGIPAPIQERASP